VLTIPATCIGTTEPDSKLHVYDGNSGGTPESQAEIILEDNSSSVLQFLTPSTSWNAIYFGDAEDNNAGLIQYYHGDNHLEFRTAGSERMRIDSSGNVGIGTTNPGAKLEVEGVVRALDSSTGYEISLGNDAGRMRLQTDGTAIRLLNTANGYAALQARYAKFEGTESSYFAGNVGIGTTSPGAKLDIRDDTGMYLGAGQDLQLTVSGDNIYFKQATQDKDIYFQSRNWDDGAGKIITYIFRFRYASKV